MIRVLISANSVAELAGLESLVRAAEGLELAGSSIGRSDLGEKIAEIHPDVLVESRSAAPVENSGLDFEAIPPTLWLVPRSAFAAALEAIREATTRGALPAWASAREIAAAIEAVARGLVVLHPELAAQVSSREALPQEPGPGQQLSPRESEILNLLASGLGNKEIAWRLKISEHTVKFHLTSIFNKLGVSGRAEAVAVGVRRGIISL